MRKLLFLLLSYVGVTDNADSACATLLLWCLLSVLVLLISELGGEELINFWWLSSRIRIPDHFYISITIVE